MVLLEAKAMLSNGKKVRRRAWERSRFIYLEIEFSQPGLISGRLRDNFGYRYFFNENDELADDWHVLGA